jgi:quinol monooxygenase YgiN
MPLTRIVKLTFAADKVSDFLQTFDERKEMIASFEGCSSVELLRDINNPNIFFTYSKWDKEQSLENYRNSELFNTVWDTVKKWFAGK